MKLSLRILNDDFFLNTIRNLSGQRLESKTAYQLGKILQFIEKTIRDKKPEFIKMVELYADKKDGKVQPAEDGVSVKILPDKMEEYKAAFDKFLDQEVDIPYTKISIKSLGAAQLSAGECCALDPLITELEAV